MLTKRLERIGPPVKTSYVWGVGLALISENWFYGVIVPWDIPSCQNV